MPKLKLAPIHPGEILEAEFLKPLKLSSRALAAAIYVTPARVSDIVAGRRGVTANTALRLGRYFGTTPQLWMNLQMEYDLAVATQSSAQALSHITPRPKETP